MRRLPAIAAGLALAAAQAYAGPGPTGRWTTLDDKSGQPRGVVEIREDAGRLSGVILRTYPKPGESAAPSCRKCRGALKDQPVIGLQFLWGLHGDGEAWTGGRIIDPETGGEYDARLRLEPDGRTLKVRGYLGVEALGRTQTWIRAD